MAAPSLLGCGRAATRKVLRLEARGLAGAAPSAALCTRPAGSGTPPAKNIAVKASMLAKENLSQKSQKEYVAKKKPRKPETGVSPVKQVTFSRTPVSHEMSKSKAEDSKVKSTPKEAGREKLVLDPHMVESQDLGNDTYKSEEKSIGTQVAAIEMKVSSATQEDTKQKLVSRGEEKKVKEAQKSAAAPKLEETSESTMLVMGTTAKEETIQEAGGQDGEGSTIEETTAADKPAPEEFDNSTYKNLQHHEYNIYTFADYITILSKYRQPQPSSGRQSPRH
ncbi:NADH dehydrogenase [ubiquinone] flavoprotein 3, mitochondrial isoform X2 [Pogoniulus pusillus]|uniref:NADH dehydrogenase [ubiquinone] flavoprotein 3, mitochondrial isoform X2 n=1 Tax=Pogoniulus pusillus TaxID=488313 RepID=UPI0030B96BE8